MPSLLSIIRVIFEENDDAEEGEQGGTTDTQNEAENAINLLEVFIDKLGEGFSNYVEETIKVYFLILIFQIITPLCNYTKNDAIRDSASKCLPGLVKCVKN